MPHDSSAVWLEELLISTERRVLERMELAIGELRRLGWCCETEKEFDDGETTHLVVRLFKTMECDI